MVEVSPPANETHLSMRHHRRDLTTSPRRNAVGGPIGSGFPAGTVYPLPATAEARDGANESLSVAPPPNQGPLAER